MSDRRTSQDRREPAQGKYIATLRASFDAEDEVEAAVFANDLVEKGGEVLEEGDTLEVTQIISFGAQYPIEPTELANEMRRLCDKLVSTRIKECFDLAQWLHKTAWALEHRREIDFNMTGYDYGEFMDRASDVLKKMKRERDDASD